MVKILDMSESDVETYVTEQCAEKAVPELMSWMDALRTDNNPEMNLSVAKLQCGLEISKGEYTRLEEGRPKFIEDFEDRLHKIVTPSKKYNMKLQKLVDFDKITYELLADPAEDFVLPEVTEALALRYCKMEEEDAAALASAENLAAASDSKAALEALNELQADMAVKYQVARNLFVTRTIMTTQASEKKMLKLKKAEAARNLKRWKISAIAVVIQARTAKDIGAEVEKVAKSWLSEEGIEALASKE